MLGANEEMRGGTRKTREGDEEEGKEVIRGEGRGEERRVGKNNVMEKEEGGKWNKEERKVCEQRN